MSRFGILYCAYQAEDLIERSLNPWVEARAARLGGHEYILCAVSVPFTGFDHGDQPLDNTVSLLAAMRAGRHIDHLVTSVEPMKETEARGAALTWLRDEAKVGTTWMVDADEFYTQQDIGAIAAFVDANPWIHMFKVSLRNAVFTPDKYLAEAFTPPRIHRIYTPGGYVASHFYDDNNIAYWRLWERDKMSGAPIQDVQMTTMTIPKECAWVKHLSWISDERGRRKCEYQQRRWGPPNGYGCSFQWDSVSGGLVWNEDHFKLSGQPIPEVIHES